MSGIDFHIEWLENTSYSFSVFDLIILRIGSMSLLCNTNNGISVRFEVDMTDCYRVMTRLLQNIARSCDLDL